MQKLLMIVATWCEPCQKLKPMVERVCAGNNVPYEIVDIEDSADKIDVSRIKMVPTFILTNDNNITWTHSGLLDEEFLKNKIGAA